jgi:phage terminase large subunit GpA-like protein
MIPTAQFAERSLYLAPETSEQHGLFSLYYAPALYGIFAALDDPAIADVVCMKSAQQAWTTGLIAYLGNRICNAPCAMIGLFDSDGAARDFHDEKLVPIIENTPALLSRIDVRRSRTAGNRSDFKAFPGGFLKLGGSGQIRKVKSTSAGVLFVEEPDDAKENVRDQGSAIQLLWERSKRRTDVKRIIGGTPSLKGLSQIEHRLSLTDRRVLPVRCHACHESHVLDLEHVTWQDHERESHPIYGAADPDTAVYACPHCGTPWDDYQRQQNIRTTVAQAIAAGDPLCGWTPTRETRGAAGFTELNEAYSCLPGAGMAAYVRDRLEAEYALRQGDQTKMIVHVNSKHGRPYAFVGDQAQAEQLRAAALDYPEGEPPAGALALAASVDVQNNRLSVLIRAYGRDGASWLVLWHEPAAAVSTINAEDPVWSELDRLLFEPYVSADGLVLHVKAVTIDSGDGGTNDAVYAWIVSRKRRFPGVVLMAGKGAHIDREIYSPPKSAAVNPANPNRYTKADRWGVRVYEVGTWRAKDHLSARWKLEAQGQGRHHAYAGVRVDYWDQILSEVKAPSKTQRGRLTWQPKVGVAHEALDCEVYVEHAARALKLHIYTPAQWQTEEQRLRQQSLALPLPEPLPAAGLPALAPPPVSRGTAMPPPVAAVPAGRFRAF